MTAATATTKAVDVFFPSTPVLVFAAVSGALETPTLPATGAAADVAVVVVVVLRAVVEEELLRPAFSSESMTCCQCYKHSCFRFTTFFPYFHFCLFLFLYY